MDFHHETSALGYLVPGLLLGALGATYWWAANRQWRKGRAWNVWRSISFTAGILLLAMALSPPLADFAHHDFRGHMAQHLLLGMLAPLLLVLAAPVSLLLRTVSVAAARRITALLHLPGIRIICHPLTALILNIGGMYLLYLTPLYAFTLSNGALHALVHWHFIAAGYLFAWAIAGPDPSPWRPDLRTRLAVLFCGMAAHAVLGKLMYAYSWPRGTPHSAEEIRSAAKLMYYGGDITELLLAIALFALWYRNRASTDRLSLTARAGSQSLPRNAG